MFLVHMESQAKEAGSRAVWGEANVLDLEAAVRVSFSFPERVEGGSIHTLRPAAYLYDFLLHCKGHALPPLAKLDD